MFLVRVLLIVVAAAGMSQPVEAEVRRLILAAGANNGGVDRELLRYAVSDAEQFVEVLQEMGGLDPADVLLLRDPDLAAFEQGLPISVGGCRQPAGGGTAWRCCCTTRATPTKRACCWPAITSAISNYLTR